MTQKICANCQQKLGNETGSSSLYFPNGYDILLCTECFFEEDEMINESGNNHPERLQIYLRNIEE